MMNELKRIKIALHKSHKEIEYLHEKLKELQLFRSNVYACIDGLIPLSDMERTDMTEHDKKQGAVMIPGNTPNPPAPPGSGVPSGGDTHWDPTKNAPTGHPGPIPGPSSGVSLPGYETVFLSLVNSRIASGTSIIDVQDELTLIGQLAQEILTHFSSRRSS